MTLTATHVWLALRQRTVMMATLARQTSALTLLVLTRTSPSAMPVAREERVMVRGSALTA